MRELALRSLHIFALLILTTVSARAQNGARFTATSANVSGAGEPIKINLTEWSTDTRRDEFVAAWTLTAPATQGRGGRGGAAGRGGGGAGRGGAGGAGRGARGGRGGDAAAPAPAADQPPDQNAAARGGAGRGGRGGAAAPAATAADLPVDPDAVDADTAARGGRGARGGANGTAQTPESSLAAAIKRAPTVGILWTSENVGYSIKYAYRLPQPDGGERIILATDRRVGAWSNLWQTAAPITTSDYGFSIIELRVNAKGEGEGRGVVTGKVAVDSTDKTIALDSYATLPVILKGVKRQAGN